MDRINQDELLEDREEHQWVPLVLPCGLIIVAWISIFSAFGSHQNIFFNHNYLLSNSQLPWGITLLLFLLSWQFMTIAMMLPALLPLLTNIKQVGDLPKTIWQRQLLFIAGYTLPWTIFALLAFLNDTFIHWLVAHWLWLYLHSWSIGTALLLIAGIFQLTSSKACYLAKCGSFCQQKRINSVPSTWKAGILYGSYCTRSCWAFMLVVFGLGINSPVWMALIALVILAEKNVPASRLFRLLLASTFFLSALLWFIYASGLLPIGLLS